MGCLIGINHKKSISKQPRANSGWPAFLSLPSYPVLCSVLTDHHQKQHPREYTWKGLRILCGNEVECTSPPLHSIHPSIQTSNAQHMTTKKNVVLLSLDMRLRSTIKRIKATTPNRCFASLSSSHSNKSADSVVMSVSHSQASSVGIPQHAINLSTRLLSLIASTHRICCGEMWVHNWNASRDSVRLILLLLLLSYGTMRRHLRVRCRCWKPHNGRTSTVFTPIKIDTSCLIESNNNSTTNGEESEWMNEWVSGLPPDNFTIHPAVTHIYVVFVVFRGHLKNARDENNQRRRREISTARQRFT